MVGVGLLGDLDEEAAEEATGDEVDALLDEVPEREVLDRARAAVLVA